MTLSRSVQRPASRFINCPCFIRGVHSAAFILVLFVFACSGASASPTAAPPTSPSDNPTAGAARRGTQAASTQLAAAQGTRAAARQQAAQTQAAGTQTAVAVARLTQTAQAAATVSAAATGHAVLAAKTAWPRRLLETFAGNELGWPVDLTQDHSLAVTSTVASGRYQWLTRVVNGNSYFNLVPAQGPVFSDFDASVSVQFVAGNDDGQSAYGLAFRHVQDDFGFFGLLKSGGFRVLEVHHTGTYHSRQSSSPAIDARPGALNRLSVVGLGPDFVFLINDQPVDQLSADLKLGQIGLGIDALTKAADAQVNFYNLDIHAP